MSFAVVLRLQLVFINIRKETKSALAQSLDATLEGRMSPTAKKPKFVSLRDFLFGRVVGLKTDRSNQTACRA